MVIRCVTVLVTGVTEQVDRCVDIVLHYGLDIRMPAVFGDRGPLAYSSQGASLCCISVNELDQLPLCKYSALKI